MSSKRVKKFVKRRKEDIIVTVKILAGKPLPVSEKISIRKRRKKKVTTRKRRKKVKMIPSKHAKKG